MSFGIRLWIIIGLQSVIRLLRAWVSWSFWRCSQETSQSFSPLRGQARFGWAVLSRGLSIKGYEKWWSGNSRGNPRLASKGYLRRERSSIRGVFQFGKIVLRGCVQSTSFWITEKLGWFSRVTPKNASCLMLRRISYFEWKRDWEGAWHRWSWVLCMRK